MPAEHQIRGLGPITMTVPDLAPTDAVLTEVMNMRQVRGYPHPDNAKRHACMSTRWARAARRPSCMSRCSPICRARIRARGGVHHVAFRTPDETQYDAWAERLRDLRIPNSGKVDRFYFQSLYFREPNGILFEIATDGPGFATDEPMETLGREAGAAAVSGAAPRGDRGGAEAAVIRVKRAILSALAPSRRMSPGIDESDHLQTLRATRPLGRG